MAKYRVISEHEEDVVCTIAPIHRNGNGRFNLSHCTQRDLKFLFEVVKHPFVELVHNEQPTEPESTEE